MRGKYRGKGMRIDYFIVSAPLVARVEACDVPSSHQNQMALIERRGFLGSDHCPIVLRLRPAADVSGGAGAGAAGTAAGAAGAGAGVGEGPSDAGAGPSLQPQASPPDHVASGSGEVHAGPCALPGPRRESG